MSIPNFRGCCVAIFASVITFILYQKQEDKWLDKFCQNISAKFQDYMSTSLHTDCRIIFGIPYEYRYKDLRQHPHKQARRY